MYFKNAQKMFQAGLDNLDSSQVVLMCIMIALCNQTCALVSSVGILYLLCVLNIHLLLLPALLPLPTTTPYSSPYLLLPYPTHPIIFFLGAGGVQYGIRGGGGGGGGGGGHGRGGQPVRLPRAAENCIVHTKWSI